MRPIIKIFFFVLISILVCKAQNSIPIYKNIHLSFEKRAKDLVSRMTLKEEISQMKYDAPAIKRLGIPKYNWWNECLHGVARNGLATVFPQAIGIAATWDRNLLYKIASAISDEARAKYNIAIKKGQRGIYQGLTFWAPNINLVRDPRWGRGMETYGEDPFLTGQMAIQFIKGLQGNSPKYLKVVATAKHYALYSGPEPARHTIDIHVSNYDLYNTYLPAFKACVKDADVSSVMCAMSSFRGSACCGNNPLLNNILRKKWGFKGYVVSDCWAIHDIYKSHKQVKSVQAAAVKALLAGTDLNCGISYPHLLQAVKAGLISKANIDTSVKRLMLARFKLGMFDSPSLVPYSKINKSVINSKAHQALALKAAEESIVLLKNKNNLLPLSKNIKKIAVIGPNANNPQLILANYHGFTSHPVTPLEGIENKVGKNVKVFYARGCDVAENMPTMKIISPDYLFTTPDKKEKGLIGAYYNSHKMTGKPVFVRVDKKIDFNWWNRKPRTDFPDNDFGVKWTGYLVPPKTGEYYLGGYGFNRYKIYFEDSLLIDVDEIHSPDDEYKKLELKAGKPYKIKIEFFESLRYAVIHLIWSLPEKESELETKAIDAVKKSDVTLLCMGLSPRLEGEEMDVPVKGFKDGDRMTLKIPKLQEDLIRKIEAFGKPVVLVLLNGSALSIDWENKNIPAILESWYGGESAGTAIANVLFGDYNPGGKLPITFYKSVKQLPPFTDYSMKGRTYRYFSGPVIYPFGYGLSYTTFRFNDLKLAKEIIKSSGSTKLFVNVTNTGSRKGDEVVQLYVKGRGIKNHGAIKSLKGFKRISLNPGETKKVEFKISRDVLQRYIDGSGFKVTKGKYTLLVGPSSKESELKAVELYIE